MTPSEARRVGEGALQIGVGAAHGGLQIKTLRQTYGAGAGQRAAGAVAVTRGLSRRLESNSLINSDQLIDHALAG